MVLQHPDAVRAARAIPVDQIDFTDDRVWRRELDRWELFRTLREERPVGFQRETKLDRFPDGPGYWGLVRYDDVRAVSRDHETFCNAQGYLIPDLPGEIGEFFGSMLQMDSPRHTRMRLIVNRSFTPRHVARIENYVDEKASSIVDRVLTLGEFDFVDEIAAALPLEIICEMMGIPLSAWPAAMATSPLPSVNGSTTPGSRALAAKSPSRSRRAAWSVPRCAVALLTPSSR